MQKISFPFWVVIFVCLINRIGCSQSLDQHKYWLGLGIGKTQSPSGMIALGYEFANKPTLLIARYTDNREIFPAYAPSLITQEFALLYGVKAGKLRFSTGISNVWGQNRGRYLFTNPDPVISGHYVYESIRYSTVGLPAEIRFITSTKSVGIGVTAFGNLNAKRSFVGLNLSLYVGKMK